MSTVIDGIRSVACHDPDREAFSYRTGDGQLRRLSYGQLDRSAAAIAAVLVDTIALPDRHILVSIGPGPEFLAAFFGVALAGHVPVPTFPPGSMDDLRSPGHLGRVGTTCDAAAMITRASFAPPSVPADGPPEDRALPPVVDLSDLDADSGAPGRVVTGRRMHANAFVMFTSGTTRTAPRGVVIPHRALTANLDAVTACFPRLRARPMATWLPPHHDMGLIGGILAPLAAGSSIVAMSPRTFTQRPAAWLEAITTSGACLSAAPNFAYDLCTRRVTDAELAGLDLREWRYAVNGAEPVRERTMQEFIDRFHPAGFRRDAFRPSYGAAEATVLVSTGTWARTGPRGDTAYARGPAVVPCGPPAPGVTVCVVDPDTGTEVGPGEKGEVWLGGASIADGYLGDPDATAAVFGHRLPDRPGTFFRTGDLGSLVDGQVHITGRYAALLRVRGKDHAAEAVEGAALDANREVRACAAFMVDAEEGPLACLVCETASLLDDAARADIRRAAAERSGLWLDRIVSVDPGTLPRTSSGKIRRNECRHLLPSLVATAP